MNILQNLVVGIVLVATVMFVNNVNNEHNAKVAHQAYLASQITVEGNMDESKAYFSDVHVDDTELDACILHVAKTLAEVKLTLRNRNDIRYRAAYLNKVKSNAANECL